MSTDLRDSLSKANFYKISPEVLISEVHGTLCGFVCLGRRLNGCFFLDTFLRRLEEQTPDLCEQGKVLDWYNQLSCQLQREQDFTILLPDDNSSGLEGQVQALSGWCQGFLYGLGMGIRFSSEVFSKDVQIAIYYIAEFALFDFRKCLIDDLDKSLFKEARIFITCLIPLIYQELDEALPIESYGIISDYVH